MHKEIAESARFVCGYKLWKKLGLFKHLSVDMDVKEKRKSKLKIALAKGKKIYDKRESIKAKDLKRDMQREQSIRK